MDKWFEQIENLANKYNDIEFLIPLHPNPNVQKHKHIFNKVKVIEPMNHHDTIEYVKKCKFVISDSGGLQEECSFLNKKIIVCRKTTERPETIGLTSFMCDDYNKLDNLVDNIMVNYKVNLVCPYGDGHSWKNVTNIFDNNKDKFNNNYWNIFYNKHNNFTDEPSTFCNFVLDYLKHYPKHNTLIDLGCGNGRDLIHFKNNNYNVTGIDLSEKICDHLQNTFNINIINDSFVNYKYNNYDIYYSRFSLHAVKYNEVLEFIKNISEVMTEDSLLFIETRSIFGTEWENNDYYEADFVSGIGEMHKRTLFKMNYLIDLFNKYDLYCQYEFEGNNLSIYNDENPWLIRMVIKKVNIINYMKTIITDNLKHKQQLLKYEFDKLVNILNNNNINYVVFFGNLIGLLRHNNLFVPWDDDIDILIDKKDIDLIETLFNLDFKIIKTDVCLHLCKHNLDIDIYLQIDLFYNSHINQYVNISQNTLLHGYKIPNDYTIAFDIFYKNIGTEILTQCVIYNHLINDKTVDFYALKIKKNINEINNILKILNN
jgi:SAM-dependent methyltransferase